MELGARSSRLASRSRDRTLYFLHTHSERRLLLAPQLDQRARGGYSLYLKERKSLSVLLVLISSAMISVAGELERATEGSYRDSRAGVGVTFLFSPTQDTHLRYFPRSFSYRYLQSLFVVSQGEFRHPPTFRFLWRLTGPIRDRDSLTRLCTPYARQEFPGKTPQSENPTCEGHG